MGSELGGVVLVTNQGIRFIPIDVVASIVAPQLVIPVPGLRSPAVGLSLADDRIVTVLEIGNEKVSDLLVCRVDGNWVGLGGGRVMASGFFPSSPIVANGVLWNTEHITPLDVKSLYASAEESIWKGRASHDESRHQ